MTKGVEVMNRFMSFSKIDGCKGYSSYKSAMKKLVKEMGTDRNIATMVAVSEDGKFFPVAIGEKALQLGLHFRGIYIAN